MPAAWRSIAPLGLPVVPEVKRMSLVSSPATPAARSAAASALTWSARARNSVIGVVPAGDAPRKVIVSSTQSRPSTPSSRAT